MITMLLAAALGVYHASHSNVGHYFGALPPTMTVAHVDIAFSDDAWHSFVFNDARARNLRVIYNIHDVAFEKQGNIFVLRSDWKTRMTAWEKKLQPYKDTIYAIYLADEPYMWGITYDSLSQVNAWWQSRGWPTMVVEQYPHARKLRPAYTYFGFTPYYFDGKKWVTLPDWQWANLLAKSYANVLVIQSFNTLDADIPPQDPQYALATPRIKLIMHFLWPTIKEANLKGLDSLYGPPPPIVFRCPPGAVCFCEGCQ